MREYDSQTLKCTNIDQGGKIVSEDIQYNCEFEGYKLTYYLTYSCYLNGFGVGIKSWKDGLVKSAECYNITNTKQDALDFLRFLTRTATFPVTLNNMVEDWLYDKFSQTN